ESGDETVLRQLLFECIEHNKALQTRNAELQESLDNLEGDMALLRRSNQQQQQQQPLLDPAWIQERCNLVEQLEHCRSRLDQLQADLRTLLDEKEELVVERDALRGKYDRVNCELNYILKGDAGKILDIDAVVMENRYLQERLNHMEEERAMAYQAVSKYKSMLERHKNAVFDTLMPTQPQAQLPQPPQPPQPQASTSSSSLASDLTVTAAQAACPAQTVITQKTVRS
uniref:Coiled-coil domain-containing protein 85C n=1 Tax=Macrostomum lignano TaxID=282301 RepID=A0A1I8JDQ6_9PLAT